MDDNISVQVSKVSKRFGDFVAVDELSFQVPQGVVYGILGPNGAGKTTTLRMINDILRPDEGEIRLLGGLVPGSGAAKRIGYLPEERGLYPKMKVIETLVFFGELRGLSRTEARKQATRWLARLQIDEWNEHRVQDLSKGMQQKVQFAAALIHDPELLILDEPWSGLDPINAEVLKDIVVAQKQAGRTVLFSTHLMEQAEQICDYVCIIARGKKAMEGQLETLKREAASGNWVVLVLESKEDTVRAHEGVLCSELVESIVDDPRGMRVQLSESHRPDELLTALLAKKIGILRFEHKRPSLHEIFVKTVGDLAQPTRGAPRTEGESERNVGP